MSFLGTLGVFFLQYLPTETTTSDNVSRIRIVRKSSDLPVTFSCVSSHPIGREDKIVRKTKGNQKLCLSCGKNRAFFIFRGKAKRDNHHDLCPRCYRSLRDRNYALQMQTVVA